MGEVNTVVRASKDENVLTLKANYDISFQRSTGGDLSTEPGEFSLFCGVR